jgi:L-fuculose-phosphate aldolase
MKASGLGFEEVCPDHVLLVSWDGEVLDRACRIQLTAMAAGGWPTWSWPAESVAKREHCYPEPLLAGAWDYLVRSLDR